MHTTVLDDPTRRRPVLRAVGWTLSLLALGLAAVMLLPTLLGYGRYVLVSGSMTGTYDTGSVVYTRDQPVSTLRIGDVITYAPPAGSSPQRLVTHRIVERTTDARGRLAFRTKGDANQSVDPWTFNLTDRDQAVVRFGVPYVGYAISAFADRRVRMLAVGVPAALIAVAALVGLLRDARDETRRERDGDGAAAAAGPDPTPPAGVGVGEGGSGPGADAPVAVAPHTVFPTEHRHPALSR